MKNKEDELSAAWLRKDADKREKRVLCYLKLPPPQLLWVEFYLSSVGCFGGGI